MMQEKKEETKNILAIDDDRDILYTLEQICRFQGWNPLLASDYREAEHWMQNEETDLILVDYHMPEMDGVTMVKRIRKKLPSVPILVLTVEERESVVEQFMEAGATDYSVKPIKAIDLIARIKVHLQYHQKSRYYESYEKGINRVTLQKIELFLQTSQGYADIDEIEKNTGIKKKTLYRYLQYMLKEGRLDVNYIYGDMGRPRTYYRLK